MFVAPVGCWQNSIDAATMLVGPDGVLYFQGTSSIRSDVELWRSDGSLAGTYRLKDIAPGTAGSWPSNLVWRQGEIVFQASGASGNRELWRTNGTEAGTEMIPLSDGAQPSTQRTGWALAGDNYYFAAGDPDHGEEPWVYDGAVAKRVADVAPGAPSSILFSYPDVRFPYFESFGSQLIFVASDGIHGNEVWRTDGTEEETVRISDIAPGSDGIQLPVYWGHYRSSLGGRPLFIEHQPGTGERLWRVDPSGSSMELVDVLNFQTPLFETRGTDRFSLTEPERGRDCFEGVGSRLFFERTRLDQGGVDLLRTDGSLSGPEEILAGVPWGGGGPCGSVGESLLYSAVFDEQGDRELLSIHSLTNETELLMGSGARIDSLPPFLESNDARIFVASASLLLTDGTPEGTAALAGGLGEYGGRIDFFQGEVALADDSLWITDGAEPGGARLLFEGDYASMVTDRDLAPLQDTIVFAAWDPDHGSELWTSDGTAEGTGLLVDANPGNDSLLRGVSADRYFELRKPRMLAAGTYAVLAGVSAAHGEELWVTDGTPLGTGLLRDIYPGDYPSTPRNFTRFGDRIFFTAESELEGLELWVTDGTYDGTVLFKDIAPGGVSSIPDDLVVRDGILYFSAWTPTHGREAWKSDGTPGGTVRITDIAPGPLSSSPQRFARAGNRLFFSATDQIHGYELWAISDDGSIPIFLDGFETADTGRWSDTAP
ncbi:MAG: hypothetical protein R2862_04275 [Thermoanaerobaculia bacterium]